MKRGERDFREEKTIGLTNLFVYSMELSQELGINQKVQFLEKDLLIDSQFL